MRSWYLTIRNKVGTIIATNGNIGVEARELWKWLIEHTVLRGKLYGHPQKMDWLNLFTQKKSRMDDQKAEGSHLSKKCDAKFLYLSQLSNTAPTD